MIRGNLVVLDVLVVLYEREERSSDEYRHGMS